MRISITRIAIIILVILLQVSFLNLIFVENTVVNLLPLLALAWAIVASFEKIWPWIILLGIFTDLFTFERVGTNVIFFIIIAYAISFFSRRFIMEKGISGFIVIITSVVFVSIASDLMRFIFTNDISVSALNFSFGGLLVQIILNIIFFYVIYISLNKIERGIERYENRTNIIS